MKKFISLALVLILAVTLIGCSKKGNDKGGNSAVQGGENSQTASGDNSYAQTIYADKERVLVEGKGEAWTLANTYKKLTQDKKLNVAYLGGSVTGGTGGSNGTVSWRGQTTKWLQNTFSDAEVKEIYAAIGGSGSLWGLMRLETDVLQHNPDLVFVEFVMNDVYTGMTKTQAAANIDAIIRKINEHNPETDIILVFITDEAYIDKDFDTKKGHRHVAEYYGIPCIDVGDAMLEELNKTGNAWSYYFNDNVHPNDIGYKVYGDAVEKSVNKWLNEAKTQTAKTHAISKTPAVTNPYTTLQRLDISKVIKDKWRYSATDKFGKGTTEYISPKEGAIIEVEFEGATLGAFCRIKQGCRLKFTVDGEVIDYIEQGTDDSFADTILLDNLAPGKHKVQIEYLGPGMFIIGALMVC